MKRYLITIATLSVLFSACQKEEESLRQVVDYNRLAYVVADNYNFDVFTRMLKASGQDKLLTEDGPFTVLAPGDDAFIKAGVDTATVHRQPKADLEQFVNTHIMNGLYEFDKLPLRFNQELYSRSGKLYVTRWAKDEDTLMSINGKPMIQPSNTRVNNGLLHVLDITITTQKHKTLLEALSSNDRLTMFTYAVERAGLSSLISREQVFTVFAPTNEAMRAYGLESLQAIRDKSPEELQAFVKLHLMQGRRFEYDFILALPAPSTTGQVSVTNPVTKVGALVNGQMTNQLTSMYDGSQITLSVERGTAGGQLVTEFKFKDARNERVKIIEGDIPVDNGVLHLINDVLRNRQ